MAYYLVQAKPVEDLLEELRRRLDSGEIKVMRPFGMALQYSLDNARLNRNGIAVWEEEDYCSPPLAQERAAILDTYFRELNVERVEKGKGWQQIESLPGMWKK
ncbi:MAG TPA: hypothetical protein VJ785_07990 [Anaerolineales bacterium]|nr:hypothetical protein [Anaerolineales bacterium]